MDKKELYEKFCDLLCEVRKSEEPEDREIVHGILKKAMYLLSETNTRNFKELVECLEGNLKYYNFLTETEADEIVDKFINQDGSRGPKWRNPEDVFHKVEELGGRTECEPHYNKWALYVTMNKFSSDQHNVIAKWVSDDRDKYFEACYELAVTQLKDKDRQCWIRPYYSVSE